MLLPFHSCVFCCCFFAVSILFLCDSYAILMRFLCYFYTALIPLLSFSESPANLVCPHIRLCGRCRLCSPSSPFPFRGKALKGNRFTRFKLFPDEKSIQSDFPTFLSAPLLLFPSPEQAVSDPCGKEHQNAVESQASASRSAGGGEIIRVEMVRDRNSSVYDLI